MGSMATWKERSRPRHLFFLTFLLSMPLFFVYAQTASAAPSIPGYTLTVAATNTSFEFGTGNQGVIGTLILPGSPTDQFDGHCFFIIDGQQTVAPSVRLDGPPWKVTFDVQLPLNFAIGTHTIIAGFTSTTYSTTIYSNPITVTVTKITPGYLACDLGNFIDHQFWPAGKSHTMEPSLSITSDQQSVSDWKTGTYTLTFTGPQNITNTDLALDSSGDITFTFPSLKGDYQFRLTFNGTSQVNAVSESGTIKLTYPKPVTISLYSTPTTTTDGTKMLYYLLVAGVPGYPSPTGQINFQEGN